MTIMLFGNRLALFYQGYDLCLNVFPMIARTEREPLNSGLGKLKILLPIWLYLQTPTIAHFGFTVMVKYPT